MAGFWLLVLCVLFACGNGIDRKEGMIFRRYKRAQQSRQQSRSLESGANHPDHVSRRITRMMQGLPDDPDEVAPVLNPVVEMAEKLINGDTWDVVSNFYKGPEFDKIFSNPSDVKLFLKSAPTLQAVKGIDYYYNKEELTQQEGLAVLDLLRNFTDATVNQFYRDPGTAPDIMNAFLGNITDPALKAIKERADAGNWNATMQLQQAFFDAQFGEIIDYGVLGANGLEPDFVKEGRERLLAEPIVQRMLKDDEYFSRFINDPIKVSLEYATQATGDLRAFD